jgi:uncharacterized membrane protein YphA (DoxX/SURF4 family)
MTSSRAAGTDDEPAEVSRGAWPHWPWLNTASPWLSLVARLGLAAMWFFYSLPKLTETTQNVASVRNFAILPEGLVKPFAYGQPYLELALGILVLIGLGTRLTAALSALVLLVYIGGIISLGARGIHISCGCGGNGGFLSKGQHTRYTLDVLRDIGYLVPAAWLIWRPKSKLALDDVLLPEPVTPLPRQRETRQAGSNGPKQGGSKASGNSGDSTGSGTANRNGAASSGKASGKSTGGSGRQNGAGGRQAGNRPGNARSSGGKRR